MCRWLRKYTPQGFLNTSTAGAEGVGEQARNINYVNFLIMMVLYLAVRGC
jgi:hypothetical protein